MAVVGVCLHQPKQEWICGIAKHDKGNILFINLFLPIQQKVTTLSPLVKARIGKDTSIVNSTWPAHIHVSKTASMVDSALKDDGVLAFPVVVVSWTILRRDDGDVGTIDCSCTLRKAKVMLKTVNNLP